MVEDVSAFNITVKGIYLNNFIAQVGYSAFFDGDDDNLKSDRDNVSLSVSYSF